MMIIADSGSSKSDWLVVENNEIITTIKTIGFNPFFHSEQSILAELRKSFGNEIEVDKIEKVYLPLVLIASAPVSEQALLSPLPTPSLGSALCHSMVAVRMLHCQE